MLIGMQVACDCRLPVETTGMDPVGSFDSDHDEARCYAWHCPYCERRILVRLMLPGDDEE